MRALIQGLVVLVLAALLGVALTTNPLRLAGVVVVVLLAAAFFSTLSIVLAGIVLSRERLMGSGRRSRCRCSSPPTRSTRWR